MMKHKHFFLLSPLPILLLISGCGNTPPAPTPENVLQKAYLQSEENFFSLFAIDKSALQKQGSPKGNMVLLDKTVPLWGRDAAIQVEFAGDKLVNVIYTLSYDEDAGDGWPELYEGMMALYDQICGLYGDPGMVGTDYPDWRESFPDLDVFTEKAQSQLSTDDLYWTSTFWDAPEIDENCYVELSLMKTGAQSQLHWKTCQMRGTVE